MKEEHVRSTPFVALAAIVIVALGGCGRPPSREMDAALAAVDHASRAQADIYAEEMFRAASDTLDAALGLVQEQEGRWYKNYGRTRASLKLAEELAQNAASEAEVNRAAIWSETETLIAEVDSGIAELRASLDRAPRGKGADGDLDGLSTGLSLAEADLTAARTDLSLDRLKSALERARSADDRIEELRSAMQMAIQKIEAWNQGRTWHKGQVWQGPPSPIRAPQRHRANWPTRAEGREAEPASPPFTYGGTAMIRVLNLLVLLGILWPHPSVAGPIDGAMPDTVRLQSAPPRPPDAISGSEFARRTAGMSGRKRQHAALAELRRGNIPEFLRNFAPVRLWYPGFERDTIEAVIWVTPDYLAIGSDEDFLRMPLDYPSAAAIAEAFGCILPTRKMVNAISEQSAFRFRPEWMLPGPMMRSSEYYLAHQRKIEAQREGLPLGELVSGHKKDIVLTHRLERKPGRIAIYGWHRRDGTPIQPLSTVHDQFYADYSHGVRLVHQDVWINRAPQSVLAVLQNPDLAGTLTYEGAFSRLLRLLRREGQKG